MCVKMRWIAILVCVHLVCAQVSYDMLYSVKLTDPNPSRLEADLASFLIVGPNMSDPVITDDALCSQHCDSTKWCIAHYMEQGFCLHVADRGTLQMEIFGPNSNHNFGWRLNQDELLYLDDKIYRYTGGENFNFGVDGPHRIDPRRISGDRNRKVNHPEPAQASNVYTREHLKPYPYYTGHNPLAASSTQWFHGYPINGIKRVEPSTGPHGVRAALHETMRLGVHFPGDTGAPVLDPAHKVDHRYFFITHVNDAGVKTYLNCQYQESDDAPGCNWGESASHKWSFAAIIWQPGPLIHNGALQAYNITTGAHQGYLDVSRCNTHPSPLRLLPSGIHSSDINFHCGIGKFYPGDSYISWKNQEEVFISKDARMCTANECGGKATIVLEPETLVENPNKFKYIRYENGSYVHCHGEGTIEEARRNTLGKFCRASPTPTQLFAVEWNYNQLDKSPQYPISYNTNKLMCITIWEVDTNTNEWKNIGSLAFGEYTDARIRLPYKSDNVCNPLPEIREEDVTFVDQTLGSFTSRLVESTTTFPGLVEINVTKYLILDPNAFKNLTVESAPDMDASDDFMWIPEGTCPADHYVSRVSPLGHLGCRKVNQYGTLGATSGTTVEITSGSFGMCTEAEEVVVGFSNNTIQCAPLTVDNAETSGPSLPFVGTTTNVDASVDNSFILDHKTWRGTPIAAVFATNNNKLDVHHYGSQCFVKFGDKDTSGLTEDAAVKPGPSEAARCKQANEYVTHIQCFESDCRQGVNVTCQSADGCAVSNKTAVRDHYCHHDEVVVGIECEGPDITGDPCPVLLMYCAAVTADATLRPSIPGSGEAGDDGPNVALIVGGIGGFTFLLLLVTTLCVCFGPDDPSPDARDVIDSEAILVGARVNLHKEDHYVLPESLKRRKTEVKYMF